MIWLRETFSLTKYLGIIIVVHFAIYPSYRETKNLTFDAKL